MTRLAIFLLVTCITACQGTRAEPRQIDEVTWEGVDRIVAIGDLHGDYEGYLETLKLAGLVNRRGRWIGDKAHLVQTGDIPDRGPDTREIMEHLDDLARQAEKDGGRVHGLIGNHEAMNLYGDLRYVTGEEFEAFKGRDSRRMQDRYYELVLQDMEQNDPEGFAALPESYRETWDLDHPLGWVEHRQSWNPAWNPNGEYAVRTLSQNTAIRINGNVFVHGGISDIYADLPLSELNRQVVASLEAFDPEATGPAVDECGPLWYRGLSGMAPEAPEEVVTSILERLGADRIIVGHTPTPGIIWPRYDGRVVQIDTGISDHYGGHPAFLEITPQGMFAGYPGGRIALPSEDEARVDYLDQVIALDPENRQLQAFREILVAPVSEPPPEAEAESEAEAVESGEESGPVADAEVVTCLRPDEASAPAL